MFYCNDKNHFQRVEAALRLGKLDEDELDENIITLVVSILYATVQDQTLEAARMLFSVTFDEIKCCEDKNLSYRLTAEDSLWDIAMNPEHP